MYHVQDCLNVMMSSCHTEIRSKFIQPLAGRGKTLILTWSQSICFGEMKGFQQITLYIFNNFNTFINFYIGLSCQRSDINCVSNRSGNTGLWPFIEVYWSRREYKKVYGVCMRHSAVIDETFMYLHYLDIL